MNTDAPAVDPIAADALAVLLECEASLFNPCHLDVATANAIGFAEMVRATAFRTQLPVDLLARFALLALASRPNPRDDWAESVNAGARIVVELVRAQARLSP